MKTEEEVITIMMNLFDKEQILKTYAKDIERETSIKIAKLMLKNERIAKEEISEFFPELIEEDIEEIEEEMMQSV